MHKENIFDLFNQQNPAPDPVAAVPENVVTAAEAKTDPIPAEPKEQPEAVTPAATPAPEAPATPAAPEAATGGEGVENGS